MRKEKLALYGGVFWVFCSLAACYFSSQRESLSLDKSQQSATFGAQTECPEVKWNEKNYCQTGTIMQACNPAAPPCSGTTVADCTLKLGTDTGNNYGPLRIIVAGLTYNCSDKGSKALVYECVVDMNNVCVAGNLLGDVPCFGRTLKLNKAC